MAVNLIATLSGTDSNSLVTVAEADAYFASDINYEEWSDLEPDDKARALIRASRALDELDFWGEPAVNGQALSFPRVWFPAHNGQAIPLEIRQAVFEHALAVAQKVATNKKGESRREQLQREGVTSFRLGDTSETFGGVGSAGTNAGGAAQFTGRVQRLLSGWTRKGYTIDSGRNPAPGYLYDSKGLWWPTELR